MALIGFIILVVTLIFLTPFLLASLLFGAGGFWLGHYFSEGWAIFGAVIGGLLGISLVLQ